MERNRLETQTSDRADEFVHLGEWGKALAVSCGRCRFDGGSEANSDG